jgi:nucleotide-binding universal stress UspA family protein
VPFERILIATDGSPAARGAVKAGLELARGTSARVTFVHASPEITEQLFAENPFTRDPPEKLVSADEVLREATELARAQGIEPRLELIGEHGSQAVADGILGVADALEADVIVVGSRGRGAVASAVLGSVSAEVVLRARVPVLVAHAPDGGS